MSLLLDALNTRAKKNIIDNEIPELNLDLYPLEEDKPSAKTHDHSYNMQSTQIKPESYPSSQNSNSHDVNFIELIHSSNKINRHDQRVKKIILSIFTASLLTISSFYFYIHAQTNDLTAEQTTTQAFSTSLNTALFIQPENLKPTIKNLSLDKQALTIKQKSLTNPTPIYKKTDTLKPLTAPLSATKKLLKKKSHAPMNITYSKKPDPIYILLNDAYNAFHNHNYIQSEKNYKKILSQQPKNRDALLGLAATATKQQRYELARQKYRYLLRLNPQDSLAIAGLSGVKHQLHSSLDESQLKFMLKQQPDSAHLYFALGTLYSSQQKWHAAQSAFFSAWSAQSENADYCYNLAVSLDHLNKTVQARNFYQRSLKLKQSSDANFSADKIRNRLRSLAELSQ